MQIVDEAEVKACRVERWWEVRTVEALPRYYRYLFPCPEKSIRPALFHRAIQVYTPTWCFLFITATEKEKENKEQKP